MAARYLISYTERKKDGSLKKKQGAKVEKFRKILKKQKIKWTEKAVQAKLEIIQSKHMDYWGVDEWYKDTGILCKNHTHPNIMIEFIF